MTTISDPGGTPSVTYNREGTAIVEVTATGGGQGGAAAIPRYSGWTVALVSEPFGGLGVRLPDDAEIGDLVEMHLTRNDTDFVVYPESGGSINSLSTDAGLFAVTHGLFRRVASGVWYAIRTTPPL